MRAAAPGLLVGLTTLSPCAEQQAEVGAVNLAVIVEVGGAGRPLAHITDAVADGVGMIGVPVVWAVVISIGHAIAQSIHSEEPDLICREPSDASVPPLLHACYQGATASSVYLYVAAMNSAV